MRDDLLDTWIRSVTAFNNIVPLVLALGFLVASFRIDRAAPDEDSWTSRHRVVVLLRFLSAGLLFVGLEPSNRTDWVLILVVAALIFMALFGFQWPGSKAHDA